MINMPPRKKRSKREKPKEAPVPQQSPVILPGYTQLCLACPYKDLYISSKNQGVLIENLKGQLDAVTKEMEKLKSKLDEESTEQ